MKNYMVREITREELSVSAQILLEAFIRSRPIRLSAGPGYQPYYARLEEDVHTEAKLFGAFLDGVPGGFMEIDAKDEEVFEVRQLCVLPAYQKQGCGQTMLDTAVSLIRSFGGVAVVGAMLEGKQWMKDWFTRNGFWEEVSGRPEGFPCQVSLLQKDLIPSPQCGSFLRCWRMRSCGGCC
jgi:GNAT superfamily N-acetyltransferase